jgi:hypothetical protein
MENNQKPEWFELADNDQPVSRRLKSKVTTPKRNFALILAGVLVLPMGAAWALLSHEDQPASAVETLNLTQDSPAAATSAPSQADTTITMPTASRNDDEGDEGDYEGDDEGDDDNYRAPAFSTSSSSSSTVVTPAATPSVQSTPAAPVTKAPTPTARTTKTPAAITPPGSSSKDIILPPTKKAGDDDDDEKEHKKKSDGSESKKSENDDEEDDD